MNYRSVVEADPAGTPSFRSILGCSTNTLIIAYQTHASTHFPENRRAAPAFSASFPTSSPLGSPPFGGIHHKVFNMPGRLHIILVSFSTAYREIDGISFQSSAHFPSAGDRVFGILSKNTAPKRPLPSKTTALPGRERPPQHPAAFPAASGAPAPPAAPAPAGGGAPCRSGRR